MALFYLVWTVERHSALDPRQRSRLFRIVEFIGKWSMVDIFVVTILVALVQLGGLLVILPGVAAISFAGVVVITIIAAESFDSRLIWDNMEDKDSVN
jgi:paraquat-inducible protein A